ncbi:MAG: terminase [Betaproteobacteria bacterium CG2_30_59_46]|nr:MAG: terminase [Betaproteobacteria bacterium CG2_30_59_46]
MPRRSKVEGLPSDVKAWLDQALVKNNFSQYELLSAELGKRGYEIGKSGLHRYGKGFEERLKTLRLVTEQARAVVQAAPDEDGAVNDALVRLTQEKMFSILMEMNVDPDAVDLPKLARAVAELGKASVAQKRWQAEARKQALTDAAKEAGDAAKSVGLTDDAVAQIQNRILGMSA